MIVRHLILAVVYSAVGWSGSCANAADSSGAEELDDAAGRIQYAFYTADARALEQVLDETEALRVDGALAALKAHHLAYGAWRLAGLLAEAPADQRRAESPRALANRAAQACAQHAEAAIAADAKFAEAYAIHAVCQYAPAPPAQSAKASRPNCREKSLRAALAIAPGNPRVMLVAALCENVRDAEALQRVVAAFEAESPKSGRKADWGYAEALALLGQSRLTQGDPVAARDALERALVIAPDYHDAQRLLETAAARPR